MDLLKQWFLKERRDLPWRKARDPYATWIAEVMLQQTVASVVVPYFIRWMKQIPDIESLANSSKEEVFKLWEGLGYYSRARNLMKGAQYVKEHFHGKLPSERALLLTIPGIGPYTSAAIASFSFGHKIAAVDANVARFIARYLALEDKALYEESATRLLPDEEPSLVAEAMIEIGATICRKKPDCLKCPVQGSCKAFAEKRQHELPPPSKRAITTYLEKNVYVVVAGHNILLKNPGEKGVLADLWEFPTEIPFPLCHEKPLSPQKHSFTRFCVTLKPYLISVEHANSLPQRGYSWYPMEEIRRLTFSSGHKRILKELDDHLTHGSLTWMGRAGDTDI